MLFLEPRLRPAAVAAPVVVELCSSGASRLSSQRAAPVPCHKPPTSARAQRQRSPSGPSPTGVSPADPLPCLCTGTSSIGSSQTSVTGLPHQESVVVTVSETRRSPAAAPYPAGAAGQRTATARGASVAVGGSPLVTNPDNMAVSFAGVGSAGAPPTVAVFTTLPVAAALTPGASHMVGFEHPALVAQLVTEYLDRPASPPTVFPMRRRLPA
jgi:hypothetical protein